MMFVPKTPKLLQLSEFYPSVIENLNTIFGSSTLVYVDRANVYGWQQKLGRRIDPKRLYQFLKSFENIQDIKWYFGTLVGDSKSEKNITELKLVGYTVRTKPVKIMKHSIDVSSIKELSSPNILKSFITKGLLHHLNTKSIEIFNQELKKLNDKGILNIEEKKCNFDVEIGVDMMLDAERIIDADTYILWSGDSDFADIVHYLLHKGKKVYIFCTSKRVSKELAASKAIIFDIQKIRDFICWDREMKCTIDPTLFP